MMCSTYKLSSTDYCHLWSSFVYSSKEDDVSDNQRDAQVEKDDSSMRLDRSIKQTNTYTHAHGRTQTGNQFYCQPQARTTTRGHVQS